MWAIISLSIDFKTEIIIVCNSIKSNTVKTNTTSNPTNLLPLMANTQKEKQLRLFFEQQLSAYYKFTVLVIPTAFPPGPIMLR